LTTLEELEKKFASLSEKVTDLEADKKASEKYISLLETKILSGPSKNIQGVAPISKAIATGKEEKVEKKDIAFLRKNYSVGEITLYAIKKNLLPRQGS